MPPTTTTSADACDQASQSAVIETAQHLAHLRAAGVLGLRWPVTVRAVPHSQPQPPAHLQPKLVHFIRHGQAYHNLIADLFRSWGKAVDATGEPGPPGNNPYTLPEVLDAPLTEVGRGQAKALRPRAAALSPSLVVVSPLLRSTQTAVLAFAHLYPAENVRWLATELVREVSGKHSCDKRRNLTEIKADFPHIDYSMIDSEEDTSWDPRAREPARHVAERGYAFFQWLRQQPDSEIVVAAHSAILFSLFNTVVQCEAPLNHWFNTGEMRSMWITFDEGQAA